MNSNHPAAIHLERVTKAFTSPGGSRYTAIQGVTLDVSEGVFLSVVGPERMREIYLSESCGGA